MEALKKIWKFIVGFVVGIGAFFLMRGLFNGKKNHADFLYPDTDGASSSDVYDNGARANSIRNDNRSATESIERAEDNARKLADGIDSGERVIAEAIDIIRRVRARGPVDGEKPAG